MFLRLLLYLLCMLLHFSVDFEYSAIVTDPKSQDEEAEEVENGDEPVFVSLLLDEKSVNVVDGKDQGEQVDAQHADYLDS